MTNQQIEVLAKSYTEDIKLGGIYLPPKVEDYVTALFARAINVGQVDALSVELARRKRCECKHD